MVYVKLFLTAVIWGGTFVAGRVVAREASPISAAFLRFAVASVTLVILTRWVEGQLPSLNRRQFFLCLTLGLSGVILYNLLFFQGLKIIPASRAAVIIAANPIFIFLMAMVFFREKMTPLRVLGMMMSVSGAVWAISRGHPLEVFAGDRGWGEVYILGCVASWVCYSLVGKVAMKDLTPLAAVTYSCILGALGLLVPAVLDTSLTTMTDYSLSTWLWIIYLGLLGSAVGFTWYYQGIRVIGPSRAGIFINFVPLSAIVLAWAILGETIDISLLMGTAMVISGVFLINRVVPTKAHPAVVNDLVQIERSTEFRPESH